MTRTIIASLLAHLTAFKPANDAPSVQLAWMRFPACLEEDGNAERGNVYHETFLGVNRAGPILVNPGCPP